ncbi:hypothetical protein [Aestuariivirga sp.]|uniref:hypothetical protein n=1 Tax=Aestuariivirga sp. TaxID=2650926 RepID=UPI003BA953D3
MSDVSKTLTLKLTNDQISQIEKLFGQKVEQIHLALEEFGIEGAKESKMKVLKISNIARVEVAGIGNVVN